MKAAIELVEYSDFECPLCAQAYHAIGILLQQFKHRIRFVFRHFPLVEIHPHAELAAEAAEAAGAQGKFWAMYRHLFENQQHLKRSTTIGRWRSSPPASPKTAISRPLESRVQSR